MASSAARKRIEIDLDAEDLDQAILVLDEPNDNETRVTIDQLACEAIWRLVRINQALKGAPQCE